MNARRVILALLATGAIGAAFSSTGSAATFTVTSCTDTVPNRAWGLTTSRPDLLEGVFTCPPGTFRGGGLVAQERLVSPANTSTGSGVEWRFTAPAGAVVTGLSVDRWLVAQVDPGWVAYIRTADGQTLESCRAPSGPSTTCEIGGITSVIAAPGFDPEVFTGLQASGLVVGVACDTTNPAGCTNGSPAAPGAQHLVGAALRNVTVTLSENTPPAITAITGPAGSGGRWVGGQSSVQVTATDVGSGVAEATILGADGQRLGTAAADCDQQARPCPSPATIAVPIATGNLPDGRTSMEAVVRDAAGLETRVGWPVGIDNTPPGAPTPDAATRPFTTARAISLRFPALGDAPVVAATWRATATTDGRVIATGRAASSRGLSTLRIRIPRVGQWRLEYDLQDAAGNQVTGIPGSEEFVAPPPRLRGRTLLLPMPYLNDRARWSIGIRIGPTLIRRRVVVPAEAPRMRVVLPARLLRPGRQVTARWRLVAGGPSYSTRLRVPRAAAR